MGSSGGGGGMSSSQKSGVVSAYKAQAKARNAAKVGAVKAGVNKGNK